MSEISNLHHRAMDFAGEAQEARRSGDDASAQSLFAKAFECERNAAMMVADSVEPTRSVLLRSAASLAVDCGQYLEAERLIGFGLAGNASEEIREELRDLYETVTFHRHLELQGGRLSSRELQLSLAGDAVAYGLIRAGEYVPRIQTLESMLIRMSERKRGIQFREHRKPPKGVIEDVSLFMSAGLAASFAVRIRLGGPTKQKQLFYSTEDVVDEFLDCIRSYASGQRDELIERIPDPAYYRNFVHQARRIAPDGKRIRMIGFTAEATKVVIRTAPSVQLFVHPSSLNQESVKITGTLTKAEIQKMKNVIGVRDDSGAVHSVGVPEGLMSDIVRPLWERRIHVVGVRTRRGIDLVAIEVADDEEKGDQGDDASDQQSQGTPSYAHLEK